MLIDRFVFACALVPLATARGSVTRHSIENSVVRMLDSRLEVQPPN